jgi:hypothetical protein
MSVWIVRVVRLYLWALGIGLLVEGAILLVLGFLPAGVFPAGSLFQPDPLHNTIHVIWGIVIVGLLANGLSDLGAALLATVFGVFYVGFAVLGVVIHHPFGLLLGPGENGFHFIVGPAGLVLGICALWSLYPRSERMVA